ncbi:hypothetical protein BU23DRAFT_575267 [Bimuria novae-zelandiae CBS 107.79]|uniref:Uncharacterized protein n=1 Tax=Bimuria novae-zelandiae CBS 107.79 TaxID=1447943 RepID=A0A6A5UJV6_9PLEO|nr:hypothetical protein BU23DRAFT_575267 [Bimuria novae-zelandiae CBS 107.79]
MLVDIYCRNAMVVDQEVLASFNNDFLAAVITRNTTIQQNRYSTGSHPRKPYTSFLATYHQPYQEEDLAQCCCFKKPALLPQSHPRQPPQPGAVAPPLIRHPLPPLLFRPPAVWQSPHNPDRFSRATVSTPTTPWARPCTCGCAPTVPGELLYPAQAKAIMKSSQA